ncbi:MAG TPA: glycine cleavage system aminomethyltransferase GcvT [Candidatus Polarisedimenticolaceae bacterium]|nr:glycine cleavage system aminomethyltransferase GcvT [Candidatus Polarisedimenticolaceae bacterium]
MKRTPLYSAHRRAGGRMVEFAGWEMPVQYSGVITEHMAVRSRAGLFDVSHMGEIAVRGVGADAMCQRLTANDLARMQVSQAQYNLLLNDRGGVIDDVIFYKRQSDDFLICVNASNSEKDFHWLRQHATGAIQVENVSTDYAQLALQGPLAETILQPLTAMALANIKSFYFAESEVAGTRCLIARTGYTGEAGFELYCSSQNAEKLWRDLLDAGAPAGLVPAGLGARDTLRLEKAYPLYGHELDDSTTPLEAGLQWVVKFSKGSFIGYEVLLRQKQAGVERKLVGLELIEPGIARSEYRLLKDGRCIGKVTSGTRSPTLGRSIALGYVEAEEARTENILEVEIRNRPVRAKIVPLPFYRAPTRR